MKSSFIVLLLFINATYGQVIESIKSDSAVIGFIRKVFPELNELRISTSLNDERTWQLADLDNNAKPDLLFTGTDGSSRNRAFVVLSKNNDNYELYDITPMGYFLRPVAQVEKINDDLVIVLQFEVNTTRWADSLFFRNGAFLHYLAIPHLKDIALIQYRTTECLGPCPVYSITIDSLGNARLESSKPRDFYIWTYQDTLIGHYYQRVSNEKLIQLKELLNYIYLSPVPDKYIWITDQPSGIIDMKFTDGSSRYISDYARGGSPALVLLHHYFDELRFSTRWKK